MNRKLPKRGDVLKIDGTSRVVLGTVKRRGAVPFHEIVFDETFEPVFDANGTLVTMLHYNQINRT